MISVSQLEPVRGKPLYFKTEDNDKNVCMYYDKINKFMELTTSHRFDDDKRWGKRLQKIRTKGSSDRDILTINSRVVSEQNKISEKQIPNDAVYATATNKDKASINEGIFAKHVSKTHKKNIKTRPPLHTICIKASNLLFQTKKRGHFNRKVRDGMEKDLIYSSCSDAHVEDIDNKRWDPMLKLYHNRPLSINSNIDVKNCVANGAMCLFKGIILKHEFKQNPFAHMEKIIMDGYAVNCIEAKQIDSLVVEMIDGNSDPDNPKIMELKVQTATARIHYPLPLDGPVNHKTQRIWQSIKLTQFPVNVANARTVHKLQGRTIKHLVISTWNYTGNWVYVVLSRYVLRCKITISL